MEEWIKKILVQEKKSRNIPLEIKSRNNTHYLYMSTTVWDKKLKKRKKISKYLGKITRAGIIDVNAVKFPARAIHEYGNARLLFNIINKIAPLLEIEFPYDYREIIAMSIVKTLKATSIKSIKSHWDKLYLSADFDAALSPPTLSEKLRRIGSDWIAQKRFFNKLIDNGSTILFDLSSIFSYSENINLVEKGHNPDHIFLKQINIALMFSEDKKLPTMLKPLPGSVKDIKSLKNVIEEFDLKKCVCVIDRGFADMNSLPNLFGEKEIGFIMPLRRNFSIIDYDIEFTGSFVYSNRGINWTKSKTKFGFLYLFQDVKLRAEEETTFIGLIEDHKKNRDQMPFESKKFGKIAVLSNLDKEGKGIYLLLKSREDVEQVFDVLKNELENDKTYLQDTDAVRGYFFISFITLYLYYNIYNILRNHDKIGKISVNDLLFELSKVYRINYTNNQTLFSEIPAKIVELDKDLELNLFPT